jgi:DNA-dependent RNA polymerase auxiliary subunit epsilon
VKKMDVQAYQTDTGREQSREQSSKLYLYATSEKKLQRCVSSTKLPNKKARTTDVVRAGEIFR